ncbi:hypothetical protein HPP92_006493 [Vanilla planifolia]|uniref:Uncharacterized protein n=1 Tax=Vanilla planifolia TaxID=51239 RepID=A0A835RRL4_VANPL|nr:hypothetical protein HPP92_006493 [Vanilla planifolia]
MPFLISHGAICRGPGFSRDNLHRSDTLALDQNLFPVCRDHCYRPCPKYLETLSKRHFNKDFNGNTRNISSVDDDDIFAH